MSNSTSLSATINGNGQTRVTMNADYSRSFVVDITGTFVATMQIQILAQEGGTWRNVTGSSSVINLATGAYLSGGNITAPGSYAVDVSQVYQAQIVSTAYTSGTVNILASTKDTGNLNLGSPAVSGTVTANPSTGTTGFQKAEDSAHANGDAGAYVFGVRVPATPASQTSAAGDYGGFAIDNEGKQLVIPFAPQEYRWKTNPITLTTTTSTALKAAGGAGVFNHITDIDIANTSATAVRVDLLDGTTVIRSFQVPAGMTVSRSFTHPIATAANAAFNVQLSAAVTDVRVSANGYISV